MDFISLLKPYCETVELLNHTEYQQVYWIEPLSQARLVSDLLSAHGVDLRLYPESNGAKLYCNLSENLHSALHSKQDILRDYLAFFRDMSVLISRLKSPSAAEIEEYAMQCQANSQGLQITLQLMNHKSRKQPMVKSTIAAQTNLMVTPVKTPSSRDASSGLKVAKQPSQEKMSDETIFEAPMMGQEYSKYSKKDRGEEESQSIKNFAMRFFVNYIASNTVAIFSTITLILILFGLMTVLYGFMCPDLAVEQSKKWYCLSDEEKEKRPDL